MLLNLFREKRFFVGVGPLCLESRWLIDVSITERKRSNSEYRENESEPGHEDGL